MLKKIVCLGVMLLMCISAGLFSGCKTKNRTEEEHLQEINKIVQAFYIEHKGAGYSIDPMYKNFTSFETQILYAFDGTPEYFLVEFEPNWHYIGIISKNRYYFAFKGDYIDLGGGKFKLLPSQYKRNNIDKENRYFAAIATGDYMSDGRSMFNVHYVTMENGKLVNFLTGETYEGQNLKEISENSRKLILSARSNTELNYGQKKRNNK